MSFGKDGLVIIGIIILALIVFAPSVVPRLTKSFGQSMKGLREGMEGDDKPAEPEKPAPKEVTAARTEDAPAAKAAEPVKKSSKDQEAI